MLNRAVDLTPGADTATSHADFSNPNGAMVDGKPWLFVVGGAYHDRLRAHAGGLADRPPGRGDTVVGQPDAGAPAARRYPCPDDAFA